MKILIGLTSVIALILINIVIPNLFDIHNTELRNFKANHKLDQKILIALADSTVRKNFKYSIHVNSRLTVNSFESNYQHILMNVNSDSDTLINFNELKTIQMQFIEAFISNHKKKYNSINIKFYADTYIYTGNKRVDRSLIYDNRTSKFTEVESSTKYN